MPLPPAAVTVAVVVVLLQSTVAPVGMLAVKIGGSVTLAVLMAIQPVASITLTV